MKFALAGYGTRGDIEPVAALGRELLRRGHEVRIAVPPNMVGFVESAALEAVAYGPDSRELIPADLDASGIGQNPLSMLPALIERFNLLWAEKSATLTALAHGADVLLAGLTEQALAANVAEYHGIPLVVLLFFPERFSAGGWLYSIVTTEAGDAQRRALGLTEARPSTAQAALELHAYDEFCLPVIQAERAERGVPRRVVGALTLELPADADGEVLSWIAAGSPPIYFGFGSPRVPDETVAMIGAACAELGERALVCAGWSDFTHANLHPGQVKIVDALNHTAVFPVCRAVVHHGGAGTTAASLRAGIPTLIMSTSADQTLWAAAVTQLKVGCGRPFFKVTQESLVADLRSILTPECAARAREVAAQMTKPAESASRAADLLEETACLGRAELILPQDPR